MIVEINRDRAVIVDSLRDRVSGNYLNDANLGAVVIDKSGTEIGDPILLSYINDSSGKYSGILISDITALLSSCVEYTLTIIDIDDDDKVVFSIPFIAIDLNACWLRPDSPYFANKVDVTDTNMGALALNILAAQSAIELYCNRKFGLATHTEYATAYHDGTVVLMNHPVNEVEKVQSPGPIAIRLISSATKSNAMVSSNGIKLKTFAGTWTTTELLFNNYSTVSGLATAINNVSGWSASVVDGYGTYPASDIMPGQWCYQSGALQIWDDLNYGDIDPTTGIIRHLSRNQRVKVVYRGGFDSIPEELRRVCADIAANYFDRNSGAVSGESIGSYSYSVASMSEQIKTLPIQNQSILNKYRNWRI